MLSGRRQPVGSLEVTYWRAYLRIRQERGAETVGDAVAEHLTKGL